MPRRNRRNQNRNSNNTRRVPRPVLRSPKFFTFRETGRTSLNKDNRVVAVKIANDLPKYRPFRLSHIVVWAQSSSGCIINVRLMQIEAGNKNSDKDIALSGSILVGTVPTRVRVNNPPQMDWLDSSLHDNVTDLPVIARIEYLCNSKLLANTDICNVAFYHYYQVRFEDENDVCPGSWEYDHGGQQPVVCLD